MKSLQRSFFLLLFSVALVFAFSSCASQSSVPTDPKKGTGYQKTRKSLPQWNTTKSTSTKYVIKKRSKSKNPQY
jgi:hypothetical protein